MKNAYLCSILLMLLLSCSINEENEFTIRGTIKNDTTGKIAVGDSLMNISPGGVFLYTGKQSGPGRIMLSYNNSQIEIYIIPGGETKLSFDAQDIDNSIRFTGAAAAENEYLFDIQQVSGRLSAYNNTASPQWRALYSQNEPAFLETLDSLKSIYHHSYDKIQNNPDIDKRFKDAEKHRIQFLFDWMTLQYPHFYKNFTGRKTTFSASTQAYIDAINLDDPTLMEVEGYAELGAALLHKDVRQEIRKNSALKKSDNRWLAAAFAVVDRRFHNRETAEFWRFKYLMKHIENNGVKNIENFVDAFLAECESGGRKETIENLYRKESAKREAHLIVPYRHVNGFSLDAHLFVPDSIPPGEKRPAIVYFHGGSWSEGKPDWQFGFSKEGFISVCIEYRTYDRYGILPFGQISDAKSAIRWLRQHADEYHVDPEKIIASGNSAGGHLALCTALLDTYDEQGEGRAVSSSPNALILTSAVYDVSPGIWFDYLVQDKSRLEMISPRKNMKSGMPPMLIFHGTADVISSPYVYCEEFVQGMKAKGNKIYFYPIKDRGHFLWRYGDYWQTAARAKQDFYQELGYIR